MNHLTEEELILHYYGEEGDAFIAEQHLDQCVECRSHYTSLQRVLNVVDTLPVPARDEDYAAEVWKRIEGQLPSRRRWWQVEWSWQWAGVAAALASLVVVAFLAGRMFAPANRKRAPVEMAVANKQASQQVLLVAVGDLLERSQMVLIELDHASPSGKLDISAEQERAADLASENRLYRQTALRTGNTEMAGVLDELERVLVDIAHEPSEMAPKELANLQQRMESNGILFKIRILGTNVKKQQESAGPVGRPAGQKL